jgi:hypothetical protein
MSWSNGWQLPGGGGGGELTPDQENLLNSILLTGYQEPLLPEEQAILDELVEDGIPVPGRYVGMITLPTITNNGVDTITIGPAIVGICECTSFGENTKLDQLPVAEKSFVLATNGQTYFIVAERIGDDVEYQAVLTREDVAVPNRAFVATVIRTGTVFHTFQGRAVGVGMPERTSRLLEMRDGFRKISGLGLSADGALNVTVNAGVAAYGIHDKTLPAVVSNIDNLRRYVWDGSTFIFAPVTTANNTQYNGNAGLVTLSNNRYNVNHLWRGVEGEKHGYTLLSRAQFQTVAEAIAAPIPAVPSIITDHCVYVGGIIYQKDATTPAAYVLPERAPGVSAAVPHNEQPALQGGDANTSQFYHLSEDAHEAASQLSVSGGKLLFDSVFAGQNLLVVTLGNIDGVTAIDLAAGRYFIATLTDAVTISFANVPAGGAAVTLDFTGAEAITWPGGTLFSAGASETPFGRYKYIVTVLPGGDVHIDGIVNNYYA